ncbi:MAG: hypothetical protein KAU22_01720 [Desulfuromonadales bacterium]|nr:hypothetical protein [Desulfuromonadales bacterium]
MKYAVDFPALVQMQPRSELRKFGTFISLSDIRSVWLRHDFKVECVWQDINGNT